MSSRLQFHFDEPAAWQLSQPAIRIRGWAFGSQGQRLTGIRLRRGNLVIPGSVGLPRPDVRIALPAAPDDNTGFELQTLLPYGRVPFSVEGQVSGEDWIVMHHAIASVPQPLLPHWLGGGFTELMHRQFSTQLAQTPRPITPDRLPAARNVRLPRIAIVTPSYQHGRFLRETVESVLQPTGPVCDYVIQDGGSTDETFGILDHYRPHLLAASSAPDGGQGDAIVRGFALTKGGPEDLMAWLNSDDFYLPGTLRFVADYFARHPEVDVIYGHRILVDEFSQEVGRWFLPKHDPEVLRWNDFVPQETLFWRRRIWDRVGGIDSKLRFAMDWDLLLRFQDAGARIVRVPYFLGCFRLHSAQKTHASIHDVGQREIDTLRKRTWGRLVLPEVVAAQPAVLRYLRRSALIASLWKLGIRAP